MSLLEISTHLKYNCYDSRKPALIPGPDRKVHLSESFYTGSSIILGGLSCDTDIESDVCMLITFGDNAFIFTKVTDTPRGVYLNKCGNNGYGVAHGTYKGNVSNATIGFYEYVISGGKYVILEPVNVGEWSAMFFV